MVRRLVGFGAVAALAAVIGTSTTAEARRQVRHQTVKPTAIVVNPEPQALPSMGGRNLSFGFANGKETALFPAWPAAGTPLVPLGFPVELLVR